MCAIAQRGAQRVSPTFFFVKLNYLLYRDNVKVWNLISFFKNGLKTSPLSFQIIYLNHKLSHFDNFFNKFLSDFNFKIFQMFLLHKKRLSGSLAAIREISASAAAFLAQQFFVWNFRID